MLKLLTNLFKSKPLPEVHLTKKDLLRLSKKNVILKVATLDPYFENETIMNN